MSWNYSGNPATSLRDYVRFLIKDVDQSKPEFTNEEIVFMVAQANGGDYATANAQFVKDLVSGNAYSASIILVERLMLKYARFADKSVGDLRISFSQILKGYELLLQDLRNRVTLEQATPFMGGRTHSDKMIDFTNPDAVQPNFRIGQQDITSPIPDSLPNNRQFGGNN